MKQGLLKASIVLLSVNLGILPVMASDDPKSGPDSPDNSVHIKSFKFSSEGGGVTGGGYFWIHYGALVPSEMSFEMENSQTVYLGKTHTPSSFIFSGDRNVYSDKIQFRNAYRLRSDHRYEWSVEITGSYLGVPRDLDWVSGRFQFEDIKRKVIEADDLQTNVRYLNNIIQNGWKPENESGIDPRFLEIATGWRRVLEDSLSQIQESGFQVRTPIEAYIELMDTYESWAHEIWRLDEEGERASLIRSGDSREENDRRLREYFYENWFYAKFRDVLTQSVQEDANAFIEKMHRIRPPATIQPWYSNEVPPPPSCDRELYYEVFTELENWIKGSYDHRIALEGVFGGRHFLNPAMDRIRSDVYGLFHSEYVMKCNFMEVQPLIPEAPGR